MQKKEAAAILGREGGKKKNPKKGFGSMTPEERKRIAKSAAQKRWGKESGEKKES